MKDATKISLACVLGIVILEGIALARGMDGTLLSLSIGALCALAGGREYENTQIDKA